VKTYYETEPCASVLNQLLENAKGNGAKMATHVSKAMAKSLFGASFSNAFNTSDFKEVYMAVSSDEGKMLYQIARSCKPRLIVEFGTSFGISAIFLGAALKDQGFGEMISTEIEANKVAEARKSLSQAGLGDVVEIREGDAQETLKSLDQPIDLLFLDGWKDLYLPIMQMLLPQMPKGSVLLADNINMFPKDLHSFREFLSDSSLGGFVTSILPIGNSLAFSIRL